jgi:GTPase involved in cell partitioning and DNA repair
MNRRHLFLFWLLLSVTATTTAQTTDVDKLTALQTEVRKLRVELLQQRIEFQQWKIAQLESDLKRVREEREKAEAEERAVQQAIAEARTDEQEEIVSPKTELIETSLKQAQARQAAGQQHEMELQEKLAREQSVLQQLAARAKQMQGSD